MDVIERILMDIYNIEDDVGYGDLCNAAANYVPNSDSGSTLLFIQPGSIPTSPNFLTEITNPLYDPLHEDGMLT